MRRVSTLMLPIERARQLKALANKRGISTTEVIESVINSAIVTGEIPDETPGFSIQAFPSPRRAEVRFEIEGSAGFPRMRATDARAVADVFDKVAGGYKGSALGPLFGHTLKVARVGRGVVIAAEDASGRPVVYRSCTTGLCRDLARQLRKAADRAEATA